MHRTGLTTESAVRPYRLAVDGHHISRRMTGVIGRVDGDPAGCLLHREGRRVSRKPHVIQQIPAAAVDRQHIVLERIAVSRCKTIQIDDPALKVGLSVIAARMINRHLTVVVHRFGGVPSHPTRNSRVVRSRR